MNGSPHTYPLDIVVLGASGDLARNKIYPALFALYSQGLLPDDFQVFGFARSLFSHAQFRERMRPTLACRHVSGASCSGQVRSFLGRCRYQAGSYGEPGSFLDLFQLMQGSRRSNAAPARRLFYLATPPEVFPEAADALARAGLVQCGEGATWSRLVVEKPFGHDRASSDRLNHALTKVFDESQIYRIDHYLGKEAVQNLLALRFANHVFEPLWNSSHIEHVHVDWAEDAGVGGRAGYYDRYGIVRDVVQNHLLQVLALTAMERPAAAGAEAVRSAKLAVLRSVLPPTLRDVRLGQYAGGMVDGRPRRGYREEKGVPAQSRTPTYAAVSLRIDAPRWRDVPVLITAGKALGRRVSEVRVRFRPVPGNLFRAVLDPLPRNELVLRIQPDEAIRLRMVNKKPGLRAELVDTEMDLKYSERFDGVVPEAYERLLLDVILGDRSLFIDAAELAAAWDVFTPVLHEIEREAAAPAPYPFGTEPERAFSPSTGCS